MNDLKTVEEGSSPSTSLPSQDNKSQPFQPSQPQKNELKTRILVEWCANDPQNPRNWSDPYKYWITLQLGLLAFAASVGSSITAPATDSIASYTNTSHEVAVLSISLYILGFAFGPLLWAPVSELWGRRASILPAMFGLSILSLSTGLSKSITAILVTRFLGGVFGSAPVSNVSAALGDIWSPSQRGVAVILYSIAVTGGPTLGPIIGSALVVNPRLGWTWTLFVLSIWVFATLVLCIFCLPETYPPVLLSRRAKKVRAEEKEGREYFHPHEQMGLSFETIITKHLSRPLRMLVTEPIVTCVAFYASFVYGILYLTLELFPLCFSTIRHLSPVISNLPFLALFIGVLLAVFINLANQPRYRRISALHSGLPVPEARLAPIAFAGPIFASGLFYFALTAGSPSISIWHTLTASLLIGMGFNVIFNQCVNVLVDTYGIYAASAVSANTFLRSIMAAAFPLVVRPMVGNLGVPRAVSVVGAVATGLCVVPWLFLRFGEGMRRRSKMVEL